MGPTPYRCCSGTKSAQGDTHLLSLWLLLIYIPSWNFYFPGGNPILQICQTSLTVSRTRHLHTH